MNTRVLAAAPRGAPGCPPSAFRSCASTSMECAGKRGLGVCLWAFEGEVEAVEQLLARDTGLHLNFLHVRAQRCADTSTSPSNAHKHTPNPRFPAHSIDVEA